MCVRKPSEHLDVMVLPATLASLTLPPSVDAGAKGPIPENLGRCGEREGLQLQESQLADGVPASRKPRRTDTLLSARERSAATLIAAHVRLHRARCDPAASRASQDAHPVAAAASSYASACAAAPSSATSSVTSSAAASASTDASLPCLTSQGEGVARSRSSSQRVKAHDVRSFHPGQDAASSAAASSSTTSAAAALG